jgi:hypothetical protein
MQKPAGWGADGDAGAVGTDLTVLGDALVVAIVETADVKTKMPARAMTLSMGFSCGVVSVRDARTANATILAATTPAH